MSKYNLFKGKARGSIGDVTFTILNDTQVAKVRNRHPRNPRTDAQMFQRAVWATIMRIYSAGKSFFSQSFEEATTPQQNMNAFTSLNMQYLRELLTQEIEQQTPINEQLGRVVHPKAGTPIPLPGLIISQGTLQADFFTISPATKTDYLTISIPAPISATETIQQYATRIGLSPEIVYTFVIFLNDPTTIVAKVNDIYNDYATQYAAYFDTLQLTCRQDIPDKPMSAATIGDIFDMSSPYNIFTPSVADIAISNDTLPITTILRRNTPTGTFGISAYHNTTLQTTNTTMQPISIINNYGIATQYIENAWYKQQKQQQQQSIEEEQKPYDAEIEYIEVNENSGIAYIDTMVKPNPETSIAEVVFSIQEFPPNTQYNRIIQWWESDSQKEMRIIRYNLQQYQLIARTAKATASKIFNIEYNVIYKGIINNRENTVTLNNNVQTCNTGYAAPNNSTMTILGELQTRVTYARIYSFRLYTDNNLILDMIPVIKNNIPYLYDKIEKKLFGAQGGGQFTAGQRLD